MKQHKHHSAPSHDKTPLIWLVLSTLIGLALVASVPLLSWMAIREENSKQTQISSSPPIARNRPSDNVRRFTVRVENDNVTSGLPISVNYGDKVFVAIEIGEQHEAELRIPGLMQSTTVERGGVKHFEFTANKQGSFDVIVTNDEPWEGETFSHTAGQFNVL